MESWSGCPLKNLWPGKAVLDLQGRTNCQGSTGYSFQEGKSVHRTGIRCQGWYYHVGETKEMKDKNVKKDSQLRFLLQQIPVSFPGKRTLSETWSLFKAKCKEAENKQKSWKNGICPPPYAS